MINASFFETESGLFTGVSLLAPYEIVMANCPPGCYWVDGPADHRRQKVKQVTNDFGEIVFFIAEWQPPKPADTDYRRWKWDESSKEWVAELTEAAHAANARQERSARLQACDWVVTKAQETGEPVPKPWREYRQALRDVSKQPGWPLQIDWPPQPE